MIVKSPNRYVYDTEIYPNVFLFGVESVSTGKKVCYEISDRINQALYIGRFVRNLRESNGQGVGFNNIGFDYPLMHLLLTKLMHQSDPLKITGPLYSLSQEIIGQDFNDRFKFQVRSDKILFPQLDLRLVNHFDNPSKSTGLKSLEFAMRMKNIKELPFKPGSILLPEEIEQLKDYLMNADIPATKEFLLRCDEKVKFREQLSQLYKRDFTNYSNSKIGSTYFIIKLESRLGSDICYYKEKGKRKINQTKRKSIKLDEVVFDYIDLKTPEFSAVLEWIRRQEIKQTKKVFCEIPVSNFKELMPYADLKKKNGAIANLNVKLDGVKFVFGTGGIHGSVKKRSFYARKGFKIKDIDAKSYYPFLSIANRIYPEHLGEEFCDINLELFTERTNHAKGTTLNMAIKEALNSTFGNSNSGFSPFFDPKYTMSITINGQLLLCMFYEKLRKIKTLELIQTNTDGITVYYHEDYEQEVEKACVWWQKLTGITLESVFYREMHVRDVNNYIAIGEDGKVKRNGKYEYDLIKKENWNKNFSALVVPRAVEAYYLHGTPVDEFIYNHEDDYDFMLCTKLPRSSKLYLADLIERTQIQNISRYYVSIKGEYLQKYMPPKANAKVQKWKWVSIDKGYKVKIRNEHVTINRDLVNYDYYIKKAQQLINFQGENFEGDY